jgi:hypothetical protein
VRPKDPRQNPIFATEAQKDAILWLSIVVLLRERSSVVAAIALVVRPPPSLDSQPPPMELERRWPSFSSSPPVLGGFLNRRQPCGIAPKARKAARHGPRPLWTVEAKGTLDCA